jgi:hypothetical protein
MQITLVFIERDRKNNALDRLPRQYLGVMATLHENFARGVAALLAGIRADRTLDPRLPRHLFQGAQWLMRVSGARSVNSGTVCLTVAGAAQVASPFVIPKGSTPASR